jgi:hypothetical protein
VSKIDDLIAVIHDEDVRRQDEFDRIVGHYRLTTDVEACFTAISARWTEQAGRAQTPHGQEIAAQAVTSGMVNVLLTGVLGIAKAHSDCNDPECRTCPQIRFALTEAAAYARWLAQQTAD